MGQGFFLTLLIHQVTEFEVDMGRMLAKPKEIQICLGESGRRIVVLYLGQVLKECCVKQI